MLRRDGRHSFLAEALTGDLTYSRLTFKEIMRSLKNTGAMTRKFITFLFPNSEPASIHKLSNREYPVTIDLLKLGTFPIELESYVLYTLFNFDEVTATLERILSFIYYEVKDQHSILLEREPGYIRRVNREAVTAKLAAISGVENSGELSFSFSFMEPDLVALHPDEPTFFILGSGFETVLDEKYKYYGVTPYTFAQAIGNPAKYAIYNGLLKNPPMSFADMEMKLFLSRNALTHNLREMRASGLVVVDQVRGQSNYYTLDMGFLKAVASHLSEAAANIRPLFSDIPE